METDTGSYNTTTKRLEIPTQRLITDLSSPVQENQPNQSKFLYCNFLYRSIFIILVIVVLPFFPSQAPEFIDQTILTRSWELLHLLFVGIAVSYGLFSRRNVEMEKEIQPKNDTAQSYVSKFSSVFDDDMESPSGSDQNKIQTWSNQYYRDEPVVVVAEEDPNIGEGSSNERSISNKPILLPVRSLKSRVSDPEMASSVHENDGLLHSDNISGSGFVGSFGTPKKRRNGSRELGGHDHLGLEDTSKANVVLPSPIPWRSRSGRMEFRDENGGVSSPLYDLSPSLDENSFDRSESLSFRSPVSKSSRPNSSTILSPKKLSPSPSLSPELRGKIVEEEGKKRGLYKSAPPPPPPPPPPAFSCRSQQVDVNSMPRVDRLASERNDPRKSFKEELKDVSRKNVINRNDLGSRSFGSESKSRHYTEGPPIAKFDLGSSSFRSESKSRYYTEGPPVAKSVRTIRAGESVIHVRKSRESNGGGVEVNGGKRTKETEATVVGTTGARAEFDQSPFGIENQSREIPRTPPLYPKEKKVSEKIISDSEDSDSYDSNERSGKEETAVVDEAPNPNEVDKKADEFIAKFREQIRLQRIESIKRSTGQRRASR